MSVITETPEAPAAGQPAQPRRIGGGLLDPKQRWKSTPDAFRKLDPRVQVKNPVMFVVEVGAVLTLYTAISKPSVFKWTIVVWLFLTVVSILPGPWSSWSYVAPGGRQTKTGRVAFGHDSSTASVLESHLRAKAVPRSPVVRGRGGGGGQKGR